MTIELYGCSQDHDGVDFRILKATFDTRAAAEAYVKASFVSPEDRMHKRMPYHPASVLGCYTGYEIEEGGGIPHNPSKNW